MSLIQIQSSSSLPELNPADQLCMYNIYPMCDVALSTVLLLRNLGGGGAKEMMEFSAIVDNCRDGSGLYHHDGRLTCDNVIWQLTK